MDFEERSYKDTCDIFEIIEITESIYEGGAPSKNNQREEAARASFGRKQKGGGPASLYNPEKIRDGKRMINDARNPSDAPTGAKKHAYCMAPGTLPKSSKCYRTTPKSTSHSDHLKTSRTAPAAINTEKQSSLRVPQRRQI